MPEPSMWSTQSDNMYSTDEFYVRSTNAHDHSESIRVRLPKQVLGQASALVASKRYNAYRTVADVIRDALVHRLHYLANEAGDDELMEFVNRQIMQARLDQRIRTIEEMETICKTTEALIAHAWEHQNIGTVESTITDAYLMFEELPEPYASRMLKLADKYRAEVEQYHADRKPSKTSFFRRDR
jgi:Arc/MetJ-type ribon-helix-helix transcriptional regulator